MSEPLQRYRDWSDVPADGYRSLATDHALGVVVDLTDGRVPELLVDLDAESSADERPTASGHDVEGDGADVGYVALLPDEWAKLTRASRALLAARAATRVDAGSTPLGIHVDLRG